MTDDPDDTEWSDEERAQLTALQREIAPPSHVEQNVVDMLRDSGALAEHRTRWNLRLPLQVAAAAAILLIGFAAGRLGFDRPSPPQGREFVLFLYDDSPETSGDKDTHVAEYRRWAEDIQRGGLHFSGEKLTSDATRLSARGGGMSVIRGSVGNRVGGYFLLRGTDYPTALRLAKSCPHLRHGGTVELREIDPITRR